MTRKQKYETDIKLGERYVDKQTGFEGIVTSITFYQHACERVALETYDAQRREVKVEVFDSPRLTSVATGVTATTTRTGGPQMPNAQGGVPTR